MKDNAAIWVDHAADRSMLRVRINNHPASATNPAFGDLDKSPADLVDDLLGREHLADLPDILRIQSSNPRVHRSSHGPKSGSQVRGSNGQTTLRS